MSKREEWPIPVRHMPKLADLLAKLSAIQMRELGVWLVQHANEIEAERRKKCGP